MDINEVIARISQILLSRLTRAIRCGPDRDGRINDPVVERLKLKETELLLLFADELRKELAPEIEKVRATPEKDRYDYYFSGARWTVAVLIVHREH